MKKLFLTMFFSLIMWMPISSTFAQSKAQNQDDLMHHIGACRKAQNQDDLMHHIGACRDGIYISESIVDLCSKLPMQSILIGGSVTNWVLKEAKLYGDNTGAERYYILKTAKKLKVGKTVVFYAQIDESTWLPAALEAYDIIPDENLVDNGLTGDRKAYNIKVKVNDVMKFFGD